MRKRIYQCHDAADYLVKKGVPFRDAHSIVGELVLFCVKNQISLDEMPLEEYQKISPVFEQDIYEAISMKTCVETRNTIGAPTRGNEKGRKFSRKNIWKIENIVLTGFAILNKTKLRR